jgi:hypothetical protein
MAIKILRKKSTWLAVLVLSAIITSAAWASHEKLLLPFPGQPLFHPQSATKDSVPEKSKEKTKKEKERTADPEYYRDLDQALEELERAIANLKQVLKNTNLEKLQGELSELSWNESAFDLLGPEIEARMKVDWEKAERDMKKAMKEFELSNEQHEFMLEKDEALRYFDMEKFHNDFEGEKLKMQFEMEKMQHDFDRLGEDLKGAHENLLHADEEMKNLKSFIDELRKDGLIKKGKEYDIKIENGELYIDGKKQPDSVTDKYRKNEKYKNYFDKENNFRIKSDGNDDDDWL